jgi:ADP-heptose:LPS heptosyltransferase
MSHIRHILFIELLGGLGDGLIALPAIHALGRSHPQAHLTVLTFPAIAELLHSDPWIHQVVCAPPGEARLSVETLLKQRSFDLIVSDTSYDDIASVIVNSGTPYTVTNLWRSPPTNQRVSDRFLQILEAEGYITADAQSNSGLHLYLTPREKLAARQALGALYRPLIVVCPDAGMPIKRWPIDHWIALGQALHQQYGATILVVVGAIAEQAEEIVRDIGEGAHLWPRGSLRQLAAAMGEADLAIAADTGPVRMAAALNVPTLTLFGPSWHGRYGQPAPHINLQGFPECPERVISNFTDQACWYSGICPFEWDTCMDEISVDAVLGAVNILLSSHSDSIQKTRVCFKTRPSSEKSNTSVDVLPGNLADDWQAIRRLLVMRLDNIGDVIMTSPALRALRENLPDAQITLLASPGGAQTTPLLPWVDQVWPWRVLWQDLGRLKFDPAREWELIDQLRAQQFDAAIILTSFSQSPHPAGLVCALAGIPLRLGESQESDWGTLTHTVPFAPIGLHQVERNLRLIESVGFRVSDRRLCLHIPDQPPPIAGPYIVLNPWTSCQSRNYDPDRFAIAARRLSAITNWPVVVTGVEKDRDRAQSLLAALGECAIDYVGQTSLSELVVLIAHARLVLTNNTSTMHIADATGVPNVILFAGTELEEQWCPRHSPSRVLRRPTVCNPCYVFACPYKLECLDISPEEVVSAGLEVLECNIL